MKATMETCERPAESGTSLAAKATNTETVEEVVSSIQAITRAWQSGITQTMQLAQTVAQARRQLRRGEWSKLWKSERMPFAKRKGEMLVVIGERLSWANAQTIAHFPAEWSILYQLTRLSQPSIEHFIGTNVIHPKLTLKEAKALSVPDKSKQASKKRTNVHRRLNQLRKWVEERTRFWTATERELCRCAFFELATRIARSNGL